MVGLDEGFTFRKSNNALNARIAILDNENYNKENKATRFSQALGNLQKGLEDSERIVCLFFRSVLIM